MLKVQHFSLMAPSEPQHGWHATLVTDSTLTEHRILSKRRRSQPHVYPYLTCLYCKNLGIKLLLSDSFHFVALSREKLAQLACGKPDIPGILFKVNHRFRLPFFYFYTKQRLLILHRDAGQTQAAAAAGIAEALNEYNWQRQGICQAGLVTQTWLNTRAKRCWRL